MNKRISVAIMALALVIVASAQQVASRYEINRNRVLYNGRVVRAADCRTFIDMGHGYGKDAENVFYCGDLLPFVEPRTFRLKRENDSYRPRPEGGYAHDDFNAYYEGHRIEGATGSTFKDLGYGYAKDAFNVYYCGRRLGGASSNTFKVLDWGYAKDAFNAYYEGMRIEGASTSSFKVMDRGYAKDAFNTYYRGRKAE